MEVGTYLLQFPLILEFAAFTLINNEIFHYWRKRPILAFPLRLTDFCARARVRPTIYIVSLAHTPPRRRTRLVAARVLRTKFPNILKTPPTRTFKYMFCASSIFHGGVHASAPIVLPITIYAHIFSKIVKYHEDKKITSYAKKKNYI